MGLLTATELLQVDKGVLDGDDLDRIMDEIDAAGMSTLEQISITLTVTDIKLAKKLRKMRINSVLESLTLYVIVCQTTLACC